MARLIFAFSMPRRARGLLLSRPGEDVLAMAPCRDIHTFGMQAAIDVAFVDGAGRVLAAYRDVLPRQRRRCPGAQAVLERYARPRRAWFREGDYVEVSAGSAWKEGERS